MRVSRLRSIAFYLAFGLTTVACGPFGYLKKVTKDASRAVAEAEAMGAEANAPYEYWGAVAYLEQARVLMAYSEYERAFDYGERAVQLAEEAKRRVGQQGTAKAPGSGRPTTVPPQSGAAQTPNPQKGPMR